MVERKRATTWITVTAIICLVGGGAAAYFLAYPQSDPARMTADVVSNVRQLAQEDLPVHVVTAPSFGTAVNPELRNSSAKLFALRVTVRRQGSNEQHEWMIELQPNQTLSLVRQGGWTFADGDELELAQDGYRTRRVRLQ